MASPSTCFVAVVGITVAMMFPLVPGHGTCPSGVRFNSAAYDIGDVSVIFITDFRFLSDLQ